MNKLLKKIGGKESDMENGEVIRINAVISLDAEILFDVQQDGTVRTSVRSQHFHTFTRLPYIDVTTIHIRYYRLLR